MRYFTIPGHVGRLVDYFERLPGADRGLARAGALSVMEWVADGRCRLRAPHFGPASNRNPVDPEMWRPIALRFEMVGLKDHRKVIKEGIATIREAIIPTALAQRTHQRGPFPVPIRIREQGCISSAAEPPPLPIDVVEYLRRVWVHGGQFFVRPSANALDRCLELSDEWATRDLQSIGPRIQRLTGVAGLIALGVNYERPFIDGDILHVARHIGIVDHDDACKMVAEVLVQRLKVVPLRPH
jgi:hypothetical protein